MLLRHSLYKPSVAAMTDVIEPDLELDAVDGAGCRLRERSNQGHHQPSSSACTAHQGVIPVRQLSRNRVGQLVARPLDRGLLAQDELRHAMMLCE